jgi:hypothetical protein
MMINVNTYRTINGNYLNRILMNTDAQKTQKYLVWPAKAKPVINNKLRFIMTF